MIDDNVDCELVWAKVKVQGSSDLYIGSFYRPPDKTDAEYLQHLQSTLSRIPTDKGAHLWLGGDFNLPDINWEEENVNNYASNSFSCNQLLAIMKDSFLDQVVMEPTRITETTSNILELFFTSNQTLINKVEIIPGISDHEAVFIESSLKPMKVKTPARKVYQYRKADYESMKKELKAFQTDFDRESGIKDVEYLWTLFKNKIHALMEKYIPSKLLRGNKLQKPWISREVKGLMRKRNKLFKRQRKTGNPKDIKHYKETKARLQKAERQSYWNFVDNIIEVGDPEKEHQPKQKRFWSFIKSLRKDTSDVAPLKDNGRLHADPKDKADILNRQYESTWTKEDTSDIPTPDGVPYPSMPEIKVNKEGVTKLLHKLNPSKASGPDLIPARILKELAVEIAPFLTTIFQESFNTGTVPRDWRIANVAAIFKKGEKYKASNYRPVSLTSLCCKVQEHIITSSVLNHLDEHQVLTDCQHGFRARRSCETQLLTLAHELVSGLDKQHQYDLIILDFSKAFDRVPHKRLLKKMDHYGVRGSTYKWIQAFLTDRAQQVQVEGATSDSITVISGVPQGTVLGPLLFLLFINDLPDCVQSSTRLFADDCILYRRIRNDKDAEILQEDLNQLAEWEKKWGMAFHPDKCSTLRISRSKNPYSKTYILKGHTFTTEDSTRYLGVELQSNMSWNKHIDQTIKKGNSMLGFLRRNLKVSNEETKTAAYLSLVRPVLEYCCSVWSPYTQDYINKLEMVQRRAARYVTNRYRNTSSVTSMLEHLEWETLETRRAKYQLTMMFKIIHGLVDIPADDHLTAASTRTRAHHSHKFRHIPASTDYYKNSFFPKTIRLWNTLPATLAEAPGLVPFKRELSSLII